MLSNNNGEARSGVVPYGVTEQGKTDQHEVLTVEPFVVANHIGSYQHIKVEIAVFSPIRVLFYPKGFIPGSEDIPPIPPFATEETASKDVIPPTNLLSMKI